MNDALLRCEAVFGKLPNAVFHHFRHALRFNLADEVSGNVARFLQAHARALEITNAVLAGRDPTVLICYLSDDAEHDPTLFDDAYALGIEDAAIIPLRSSHDPEAEAFRHWVFIDQPVSPDLLLWSALAGGVRICPSLPGWHYLVELESRVIVYPYDERGMDVASIECAPLTPLYHRFGRWLLDHDRPRMDATFGTTHR